MAEVRTRALFAGTVAAGDPDVDIAPDVGNVMVVSNVDCYSNAPIDESKLFFQDTVTGGAWLYLNVLPTQKGSRQWQGRQAFDGDGFTIHVDNGTWDIRVTGWELQLP